MDATAPSMSDANLFMFEESSDMRETGTVTLVTGTEGGGVARSLSRSAGILLASKCSVVAKKNEEIWTLLAPLNSCK